LTLFSRLSQPGDRILAYQCHGLQFEDRHEFLSKGLGDGKSNTCRPRKPIWGAAARHGCRALLPVGRKL